MPFPISQTALLFTSAILVGQFATSTPTRDPYLGQLSLNSSTFIITEAVSDLNIPWDIETTADGSIWFTQHAGSVSRYDPTTGQSKTVLSSIPDLYNKKSLGLFGMALHPDFKKHPHIFLHYAYRIPQTDLSEKIETRLVRYTYNGTTLSAPAILLDKIPGQAFHNGSRILITPDEKLYLATGDIGSSRSSQDPTTLTGKILRINIDGSIPADNPIPGSYVWSIGHRNPQGLATTPNGKLYASEHGPNNDDEINLIQSGYNYGWPIVEGFIDTEREIELAANKSITEPLFAWTPTIATAGLAYYQNPKVPEWDRSLLLVSLKGQALRSLQLDKSGEKILSEHIYFQKRFGRLRDVAVANNGDIYLATSNLDWHPRYQPWMYDSLPNGPDRIIRLHLANAEELAAIDNPILITEDPEPLPLLSEDWNFEVTDEELEQGQTLYFTHCVACHNPNGTGAPGLFPPLAASDWVTGDKARLIQILLNGMSGPIQVNGETYNQEMPSFANLTDQELAAILSYIRKSFGNDAEGVIPGEIYEERKGLKN